MLDLVVEHITDVQWQRNTIGWTNEIMILQGTYNSCDVKYIGTKV